MLNDLTYAIRMLLKRPSFTATALITLALGITANTTIFTFVNAFLLKPFPFPNSERLMSFGRFGNSTNGEMGNLSFPDFDDIRQLNQSFRSVAAYTWSNFNLATKDRPIWAGGAKVTADFFSTLQVQPIAGRTFTAADDAPGAPPTLILSEALWGDHFGRQSDLLGEDLMVDGIPRTVIGIIPRGQELPMEAQLWIPLSQQRDEATRNQTYLNGIGRLVANATPQSAQAELATLGRLAADRFPNTVPPAGFDSVSLREDQLGKNARLMFYLLLAAVGLLLLIVCTNVANLQLSRSVARHGEFAIRSAIGATRGHLVRQLLIESLLLASLAALIGLGLSRFAIDLIKVSLPPTAASWFSFDADHRVLIYTGCIALLTTLFFGLLPALRISRTDPTTSLGSVGSRTSSGRSSQRLQSTLVVAEMAFALGLLAAGSVMVRGLLHLANESPGFVPQQVLTASLSLSEQQYPTRDDRAGFGRRLRDGLGAIPGVAQVGFISEFPLSGSSLYRTYSVEGQTDTNYQSNPDAIYKAASPNFFSAMGIRILEGRGFLETDRRGSPQIATINQPLAKQLWPSESAIGKRIKFDVPSGDSAWVEIVGVVEGTKHEKINRPPPPQIYVAYAQAPSKRLSLAIKSTLPTASLVRSVEEQLRAIAPHQALFRITDLDQFLNEAFWSIRMTTNLFWIFGAIALSLSAIGIYGVMMFAVQERHQEIGIRMALGAVPNHILKLVLHHGLKLGLTGIVLGLVLGLLMTKALASAILGTSQWDFLSLLIAAAILLAANAIACLLPGLRAASADPVAVLRNS